MHGMVNKKFKALTDRSHSIPPNFSLAFEQGLCCGLGLRVKGQTTVSRDSLVQQVALEGKLTQPCEVTEGMKVGNLVVAQIELCKPPQAHKPSKTGCRELVTF